MHLFAKATRWLHAADAMKERNNKPMCNASTLEIEQGFFTPYSILDFRAAIVAHIQQSIERNKMVLQLLLLYFKIEGILGCGVVSLQEILSGTSQVMLHNPWGLGCFQSQITENPQSNKQNTSATEYRHQVMLMLLETNNCIFCADL